MSPQDLIEVAIALVVMVGSYIAGYHNGQSDFARKVKL